MCIQIIFQGHIKVSIWLIGRLFYLHHICINIGDISAILMHILTLLSEVTACAQLLAHSQFRKGGKVCTPSVLQQSVNKLDGGWKFLKSLHL